MKLTLHLNTTLYDCILRLRGEGGFAADYRMTATAPLGSALMDCVTVEVPVDTCEVTVCPPIFRRIAGGGQGLSRGRGLLGESDGQGTWEDRGHGFAKLYPPHRADVQA